MSTTIQQPVLRQIAVAPKYSNAGEWVHALGDIPLSRIVFDPWPGTATEDDLLLFAERDNYFCELIDGTLVEKALGFDEEQIGLELARHMKNFTGPSRLGWVSGAAGPIRMASGHVRLPDVAFIARSSFADGERPRGPIPTLPPTLAVEILSPSNTRTEMTQKLKEYFASGCKLAWIIDPLTQTCEIYRAPDAPTRRITADEDLDGEDVLPGFRLRLGELFVDL